MCSRMTTWDNSCKRNKSSSNSQKAIRKTKQKQKGSHPLQPSFSKAARRQNQLDVTSFSNPGLKGQHTYFRSCQDSNRDPSSGKFLTCYTTRLLGPGIERREVPAHISLVFNCVVGEGVCDSRWFPSYTHSTSTCSKHHSGVLGKNRIPNTIPIVSNIVDSGTWKKDVSITFLKQR